MTNSSVGDLMFIGVRNCGWIFWYWHKIKQSISRGNPMTVFDKIYRGILIRLIKQMDWYKYEMVMAKEDAHKEECAK